MAYLSYLFRNTVAILPVLIHNDDILIHVHKKRRVYMEFGRAFSYTQKDPDWLKKVGIAGLLMFIPFIGWLAVLGWGLEITRRVISHEPEMLPEWSNFTEHLVRGLKGFVISFVFSLPGALINGGQNIITTLARNPQLLENMDSRTIGMLTTAASSVAICCGCFGFIFSIAATFILPAAYGNMMANNGDLGAGFRFGEIFALIRAAVGPYLMTLLGSIVVGIIVPFGLIACIIGVFFTAAWGTTVVSHLYGQAYNAAKAAQAGTPVAPVAPAAPAM
jgi:hypothetical protein